MGLLRKKIHFDTEEGYCEMLCLKMTAEIRIKETTAEKTLFCSIGVTGIWEDLGNRASESTGNNLWAQLMKRELLSLRNAINMGCDIWNPIVRSYRLPYIAEAKQSTLEGIVSSIMLTLLKVKMMK